MFLEALGLTVDMQMFSVPARVLEVPVLYLDNEDPIFRDSNAFEGSWRMMATWEL